MKNLDKEEKALLESYENEEWVSDPDIEKRRKEMSQYAAETMRKDKRVNIRQVETYAKFSGLHYVRDYHTKH